MRCPNCGSSDCLSVATAWEQVQITGPLTPAAQRLAPPKTLVPSGCLLLIVAVVACITVLNYMGQYATDDGREPLLVAGLLVLLAIVVGTAFGLARLIASATRATEAKAALWRRQWYCKRCGAIQDGAAFGAPLPPLAAGVSTSVPVAAAQLARPPGPAGAAVPVLRVARPTDDLEVLLPFYRDGLGLAVLARFDEHSGFSGLMLGLPGARYHLEFTRKQGHLAGRAPSQDNLLVFYFPAETAWRAAVQQMRDAGFAPVPSFNPYWERTGATFEDPDGYRVVLQHGEWDV